MSNVGYATLNVIPSVRGVGAAVSSQIVAPVSAAGVTAGRSAGSGIIAGIVNGARSAVKTAGKVIGVGLGVVVTAAAGVAALAFKGGFSRALNIQDAQKQLLGLGNSTETVTTIMENALASVTGTAFGLDKAATLAASVVAAGVKPGQDLTRVLKLTADAATIAKTPLGEMGQIINKVASSGKLSTEVLQQFSQRGVPLLQFVATEYGVTADEASKMVTRGEVDFGRFQNALETGVGGAALSSGGTARGAFANIGAALSRFGALFATPLIAGAPSLFVAVASAVDRASTAVTPFSDAFAARLVPALAAVQRWVDGLDFGVMIGGIKGLYDLVIGGDFTGALRTAFNWDESSMPVAIILGIRDAILGTVDAIKTGNWDALGSAFGDVGGVIQPLIPLFVGIGKGLGGIAGNIGDLIGAGLPLLVPVLKSFTEILGWLADHTEVITPLILALGAGFLIYRSAQIAATAAALLAIPVELTRAGALFASAVANNRLADATLFAAGAERQGLIARLPATAAAVAQTAANVGGRIAMLAGAAATGVVTAAQWAWNAAQTANPIGLLVAVVVIVIAAIAALVAGIVWVATKTTFFQDVWAGACAAVGAAMTWLWESVISPALAGIGALFNWLYQNAVLPVVDGIAALFTWLYTNAIKPTFDGIAAVFTWIYDTIIVPIIIGIALYIAIWVAIIQFLYNAVILPIFQLIGALFTWLYESVILPVVAGIVERFNFFMAVVKMLYDAFIAPIFAAIGAAAQWLGDGISAVVAAIVGAFLWIGETAAMLYTTYILPFFTMIGDAISFIWNAVIKAVIDFIIGYFNLLGRAAKLLYSSFIKPALDSVGGAFSWLWNSVISPIGNFISGAIHGVGDAVHSVFSGMASFIGDAFTGALSLVRGPINGIIGLVNSAIRALNGVSVTIPDFVPGIGGQTFGIHLPLIPRLASGANVRARAGGTLAVLGEAGRAETVTDLGSTNRLIALTSVLAEKAVGRGEGDRVLKVENLGYDPAAIFTEWDARARQAALLEGLSISGGIA